MKKQGFYERLDALYAHFYSYGSMILEALLNSSSAQELQQQDDDHIHSF